MNSLEVRKFQQQIISLVNQSSLPLEVKRLCFLEITQQISEEAEKQVYAELEQERKNQVEEKINGNQHNQSNNADEERSGERL